MCALALQRILQVEYEFPPHVKVSKECRDLLHKILVPDPAKRITVPEIQNHVWYKKDLPPGVAEMNDNLPPPGAGLQVPLHYNLDQQELIIGLSSTSVVIELGAVCCK